MQIGGFLSPALAVIVCFLALVPEDSRADDVAVGSVRLRGGYDANPQLLPGGRGGAFAGIDAAFAMGRSDGGVDSALSGEFQRADYATRGLAPAQRAKVTFDVRGDPFAGWTLKSQTSVESIDSATTRSFDAVQSLRLSAEGDGVRPFVVGELRYSRLNETNAILTDFLPEDQRFVRATVIPGAKTAFGHGELGASVNFSATRYETDPDLFGYRRRNERIQPFLFYRADSELADVSLAVSQLYGTWHDPDFSPVRALLFDFGLTLRSRDKHWQFDASGRRSAADTTFPISPLTISETYSSTLSYGEPDRWRIGATARWLRTAYLDAPFSSAVVSYGLTGSYRVSSDWSVGADVLRIHASALNGERVDSMLATLSLTRRFAFGEGDKKAPVPAPQSTARPAATPSASATAIY